MGAGAARALLCDAFGGPEGLSVRPFTPRPPAPGEVLMRIEACGVNFADTLMIAGQYQERPPFPFSPGMEVAGKIEAVGEGVDALAVGDAVAALCGHGGMATHVTVAASLVVKRPPGMDAVTAAAFTVAYGTSHVALTHRARLQPGETLLVHGAAGGVGLTAVEIGKLLGATVIATASTPAKLALAAEYGADHTINYTETDFRPAVKELTNGRGVDVVFDPVGGDVFTQSLRCLAWEGRLLVIGFAGGDIPQAPANLILVKNISIVGVYWGAYSQRQPSILIDSMRQLMAWFAAGQLRPHISQTYSLTEGPQALSDLMARRTTGKLVVTP